MPTSAAFGFPLLLARRSLTYGNKYNKRICILVIIMIFFYLLILHFTFSFSQVKIKLYKYFDSG